MLEKEKIFRSLQSAPKLSEYKEQSAIIATRAAMFSHLQIDIYTGCALYIIDYYCLYRLNTI